MEMAFKFQFSRPYRDCLSPPHIFLHPARLRFVLPSQNPLAPPTRPPFFSAELSGLNTISLSPPLFGHSHHTCGQHLQKKNRIRPVLNFHDPLPPPTLTHRITNQDLHWLQVAADVRDSSSLSTAAEYEPIHNSCAQVSGP